MSADASIDVLIAHDRFATDQLFGACDALTDAQLDQPFDIGRGSLRKTMVHMLNVISGWQASLEGAESDDLPADASLTALRQAHVRVRLSFERFAKDVLAKPMVHATRGGRSMDAPSAAIITHILTHGAHHRAQALNMLRQLGVNPLPKSSVLEWMFATGVATLTESKEVKP